MSKKLLIIVFILASLLTLSVLGEFYLFRRIPIEVTLPSEKELHSLWGFNWTENLSLVNITSKTVKYQGTDIRVLKLSYTLFPWTSSCRIYGWLYYRADLTEKSPGILLVHGIGGTHLMFEKEVPIAYLLASRGYIVLSIDAAGHGESCIVGSKDWIEASRKIDNIRQNLFYQVYVSAIRGIEVLKKIPLVDTSRLGVSGVSMGGMTAIVVGSLHPDVKVSIPIVASGCISCMFRSGGFANLIGDPHVTMNRQVLQKIALIDPLTYAGLSARNKKFFFLYSTHDEYFPLEGLVATVDTLRSRGDYVAVFIAPNNDHYNMYPGWEDSIVAFLSKYLAKRGQWDLTDVRVDYSPLVAGAPLAVSIATRPLIPGIPFFVSSPPYAAVLFPVEVIGIAVENGITHTSLPVYIGSNEGVLVAAFSALLLVYAVAAIRRHMLYKILAVAAFLSALALYLLPFAAWSGRFSVTYLELYDRFGVLLSGKLHFDLLVFNLLLIAFGPALVFSAILYGRKTGLALSWVYAVLQAVPLVLLRTLFSLMEKRVGYPLPITVYPLEVIPIGIAVAVTGVFVAELVRERRARIAKRVAEEEAGEEEEEGLEEEEFEGEFEGEIE